MTWCWAEPSSFDPRVWSFRSENLVDDDHHERRQETERLIVADTVRRAREAGCEPVDSASFKWRRALSAPYGTAPADGSDCWRLDVQIPVAGVPRKPGQ